MLNCFSCVFLLETPWTIAHQAPLTNRILQAKTLEWVAISSSRGIFPTQDRTHISYVSCLGWGLLTTSTTWEAPLSFSVQFSHSVVSDSFAAHQAFLSITNSRSLFRLMSIESVRPSNHLILCRPLLLPPSVFPSIRVFSDESVLCIRWPQYRNFSIRPSSEYSGLISFRMHWLDHLAVQGTLKSVLQHHSSKASIPLHSNFFIVQLSHLYMTTRKTIALTRRNYVGKAVSLLFSMLSRLVITFLPRNNSLLILWLKSPPAVILKPKKNKVSHCFHCFPNSLM